MPRLSRAEMSAFHELLGQDLRRWRRIIERLQQREEWDAAKMATVVYNEIHRLAVHAHYESCAGGVASLNDRDAR